MQSLSHLEFARAVARDKVDPRRVRTRPPRQADNIRQVRFGPPANRNRS